MTREELLNIIETDHVQCGEAAALAQMALAFYEWQDKTAWVQTDKRFDVLLPWGKHRADVLKEYIEHLENRVTQASPVVPVLTRADFENWCQKTFAPSPSYFEKDVNGVYTSTLVHDLYVAWEGCRAAMLATVPQETDHVRK